MDETLIEMRQKIHQEMELHRHFKRLEVSSENRTGLKNLSKKTQPPDLQSFQSLCTFFSKGKKDPRDLERIVLGLSQGSKYADVFLSTTGCSYALTWCLTGANARLQISAVRALAHLGRYVDGDSCAYLINKNGTYLLLLLLGENDRLQSLCCWALGNLCGSHVNVSKLLKEQGFDEVIEKVLKRNLQSYSGHTSKLGLKWTLYAANLYLSSFPNSAGMLRLERDVSKSLIEVIRTRSSESFGSELAGAAAWLLFAQATSIEACRVLISLGISSVALDIMKNLVSDSKSLEVSLLTPLVRLLSNCIATENSVVNEICYRSDDFSSVVFALVSSPWQHLRSEAWQLVANLLNGAKLHPSPAGRTLLEDSNMLEKLGPSIRRHPSAVFGNQEVSTFDFSATKND